MCPWVKERYQEIQLISKIPAWARSVPPAHELRKILRKTQTPKTDDTRYQATTANSEGACGCTFGSLSRS
jgi:hypothetical protein